MRNGNREYAAETASGRKIDVFFPPLAAILLFIVFSLLFFATALIHISRVEKALINVLESKGFSIIENIERISRHNFNELIGPGEKSPQFRMDVSSLETGFSMRESMAWHLIEIAREIDSKEAEGLLLKEALSDLIELEHLLGIAIFNKTGKNVHQVGRVPEAVFSAASPLVEEKAEILIDLFNRAAGHDPFGLVGLRRKAGSGSILLVLDDKGLLYWGLRVAIQDAIEVGDWRKDTLYFVVQDSKSRFLAAAGEFSKADFEAKEALAGSNQKRAGHHRLTSHASGILEVYAPLRLDDDMATTARVGLDTSGMDALIQKNRTHIFISAGVMMAIGLLAIRLYYRNQKRHLIKIQEMGARLHQAERLSSLGHLAAGVAHEIRNPLNAIGMAAQRIQRECGRADDGRDKDLLQFTGLIRDEVRRLNRIVEDFLGLSRNRFELRPQSVVALLERLVHLIREEADSRQIRIDTRWEDADPIVYMDANKMKQALLNITKNAFESMTAPGTLGFRVSPYTKKYMRIHISDTGFGIRSDMQQKIFDPHFTTKDKGLGLGLPIAYEIIRAHSGEIRVHSEPGRGTVFEILVPRERKSDEESGDTGRRR